MQQTDMMIHILKSQAGKAFRVIELARAMVREFPESFAQKRQNPKFHSDEDLAQQVRAEIYRGNGQRAQHRAHQIKMLTSPRRYYWQEQGAVALRLHSTLPERQYTTLIQDALAKQFALLPQVIQASHRQQEHGPGGNYWLYPDLVALDTHARNWHGTVQQCAQLMATQYNPLWSFEIKRTLARSNVRKSFFQALSHSAWAHYAYVITTDISRRDYDEILAEFQMLSVLHGVGLMRYTMQEHQLTILIPARFRSALDWPSMNRLARANPDFEDFLERVCLYHQTGYLRQQDWMMRP